MPALMSAYMRAVQVTEDPILVTNFFVRLATGTDLKLGQPIHTLRGYLIRSKIANRLLDLYSVVRAWNAERCDEPLGKMQFPKGGVSVAKFPDMVAGKPLVPLTELDEQAAEAVQKLDASHAA
jgi:hypothetical protein